MKEQIVSILNGAINERQKEINSSQEWMKKDFNYFFTYLVHDYYKCNYEIQILNKLLADITEETCTIETMITYLNADCKFFQKNLMEGKVIPSSTNMMNNIAYLFKMESQQKLFKLYSRMLSILKK